MDRLKVDCRSHPNYHLHNSLRSFCPPPDLEIMAQRSRYLLLHRFSLSSPGVEAIDVGNHHVDLNEGQHSNICQTPASCKRKMMTRNTRQ